VGAGSGQFFTSEQLRFATALEKTHRGDKARPIVFLCLNSECWLSYNAALHAVEAGYRDVICTEAARMSWRARVSTGRRPTASPGNRIAPARSHSSIAQSCEALAPSRSAVRSVVRNSALGRRPLPSWRAEGAGAASFPDSARRETKARELS